MDRESTTPFLLRLFYRQHAFHHLTDFPIASLPSDGSSSVPVAPALPPHLQIYTWPTCTLRELGQLLTLSLPSLLPDPAVGTRLNFRLLYPDAKQAAGGGSGAGADGGRYLSKDMGSVVVGADNNDKNSNNGPGTAAADAKAPQATVQFQGDDADKTLQDLRFIIGDFVDCAIIPPLADGSVAPQPPSARGQRAGGMRAFGGGAGYQGQWDSFQGRPRGGPPHAPGPPVGRVDVPAGGWTRGERLPRGDARQPNGGNRRGSGARPY